MAKRKAFAFPPAVGAGIGTGIAVGVGISRGTRADLGFWGALLTGGFIAIVVGLGTAIVVTRIFAGRGSDE
ncbi:MAG: hypothetical protein ABI333_16725 [bacterium]